MLVQMALKQIGSSTPGISPRLIYMQATQAHTWRGRHIKGKVENFSQWGMRLEESSVKKSD
jgi:hypothetical protein